MTTQRPTTSQHAENARLFIEYSGTNETSVLAPLLKAQGLLWKKRQNDSKSQRW